jgi:hypothetical protein
LAKVEETLTFESWQWFGVLTALGCEEDGGL